MYLQVILSEQCLLQSCKSSGSHSPVPSVLLHRQVAEAAGFQQDSHRDRWYWSSAVTHAGLSTAPTSRHSARKIHTRPTNFRGVNADTRISSAPLTDEAMSAGSAAMRSDVALRRGEARNDDPRQCLWIRIRDQCFEDCGAVAREGRCNSCPRAPVNATALHIIEKSRLHLQGPSA